MFYFANHPALPAVQFASERTEPNRWASASLDLCVAYRIACVCMCVSLHICIYKKFQNATVSLRFCSTNGRPMVSSSCLPCLHPLFHLVDLSTYVCTPNAVVMVYEFQCIVHKCSLQTVSDIIKMLYILIIKCACKADILEK